MFFGPQATSANLPSFLLLLAQISAATRGNTAIILATDNAKLAAVDFRTK